MKLFKSLLVAPAALGLLAPMSVTANELNITEVSDYSSSKEIQNVSEFNAAKELAVTKSRVDGLEARFSNFEAGSFSETTTASFSADFAIGAEDGKGLSTGVTDGDEDVQAVYGFQIDLNTSFTGEDSLDISIDAGNGPTTTALSEFDINGGSDTLTVDGVSYTFPVGEKMTAIVGDNTDGSALFTTACVYGGPSNTLDDCGNVNAAIENGGAMAGASFDFGSGFTAAVGYAGPETGILTEESMDAYGANVAYSNDNSGISLTYGLIETAATTENTFLAVNGYYSLDNGMSISAGYEVGDIGANSASTDESVNYFVGINGEVGPGELGVALGTSGGQTEGSDTETMYEAYYSYPINDGMTITPLVYVKEQATAGTPDLTGMMVKTSFSF
jgi:hypothetical protein